MTRSRACAVLAFVLTLTAVVYALPTIQVTPLPRDGRLLVSFRLTDAFSDEVKTAIHSGLTITFVYYIELRRSSAMWVDRTIARHAAAAEAANVRSTPAFEIGPTGGRLEPVALRSLGPDGVTPAIDAVLAR